MAPMTQELTNELRGVQRNVVDQLIEQARRDLAGEGLTRDRAVFILELDMLYGGQFNVKRTPARCCTCTRPKTSAPSATRSRESSAKPSAPSW